MEENVKAIVAKNLTELRKAKNLTQGELATQLNYSDKSISKWENGDSLPDIAVLCEVAQLYGVTLNDLVKENAVEKLGEKKSAFAKFEKIELSNNVIIFCLWISVVFLIATLLFVYLRLNGIADCWQAFMWAFPVCAVMFLRFNKKIGGNRRNYFIGWTILVWSILIATFFQFYDYKLYLIFLVALPIQAIIWLSSKLNK